MNQGFNQNDFERFLKENAEQHKMYPADSVWKGIYSHLHLRSKWQLAVLFLLISVTGIAFLIDNKSGLRTTPSVEYQLAEYHPNIGGWENLFSKTLPAYLPDLEIIQKPVRNITSSEEQQLLHKKVLSRVRPSDNISLPKTAVTDIPEKTVPALAGIWSAKEQDLKIYLPAKDFTRAAIPVKKPVVNTMHTPVQYAPDAPPVTEEIKITDQPKNRKITWQLSAMPTTSFRRLTNNSRIYPLPVSTFPLLINASVNPDALVNHTPAFGFEIGTHMLYHFNNRVRFKTGVQFNYSKYDIQAYSTGVTERVQIVLNDNARNTIHAYNTYTNFRNFGGDKMEQITNQYIQVAVPVGLEYSVIKKDKLEIGIAGSLQPNYLVNANSYLITTDFKNYTKAPDLLRKFNLSSSAEIFISYEKGSMKWQIGPVFRYQLQSSFINAYPIREHIMEYGLKIAVSNVLP